MPARGYGQYCGLARALELIGERWALLIIRDLLVGPRRFTDLRRGLPRIPSNVLSDRLKELEQDGIVQRRVLPRPASATVYELTPYGTQLEQAVVQLGLWGGQSLGEARPEEIVTPDSITMALRSTFIREAATGQQLTVDLCMGPEIQLQVRIEAGSLQVSRLLEPSHTADLVVECGPVFKELLTREVSPATALQRGLVRLRGDPKEFDRFAQMFYLPSHRETTRT
jgi:DNA-binding HxlR family transcriptional regulator